MTPLETAGKLFREQREARGMSTRKVGKMVGCAATSVSQIERGQLQPGYHLAGYLIYAIQPPAPIRAQIVDAWSARDRETVARWEEVRRG